MASTAMSNASTRAGDSLRADPANSAVTATANGDERGRAVPTMEAEAVFVTMAVAYAISLIRSRKTEAKVSASASSVSE